MNRSSVALLCVLILLGSVLFSHADEPGGPVFLRTPALSPDGRTIAFEYRGDIWTVPVSGGAATQLTIHMADEIRPLFSADGKWIIYSSNCYGDLNLYVIPSSGGDPRRLTWGPGADTADSVSSDGKFVYFTSSRDMASASGICRVPFEGGFPVSLACAPRTSTYSASVSPDGKLVAFNYRSGDRDKVRAGNRTHNTSEIYIADATAPLTNIRRLTSNLEQDFYPVWTTDGRILCLNDSSNSYQLTSLDPATGAATRITELDGKGIADFSVATDGTIVVERNYRLYRIGTDGKATLIDVKITAGPKITNPDISRKPCVIRDFALSPDGMKVAFISEGEVFVMASDGGYAKKLTNTPGTEEFVLWTNDSKAIFTCRVIDTWAQILRIDAATGEEAQITKDAVDHFAPTLSPDGKTLYYRVNDTSIRSMVLETGAESVIVTAPLPMYYANYSNWPSFKLSDDGKWLIYGTYNDAAGTTLFVKPLDGSAAPVRIFSPGSDSTMPIFSADLRYFVFSSVKQDDYGMFVVDFKRSIEPYKDPAQELDELLNPPAEEEKKGEEKEPAKTDKPKEEKEKEAPVPPDFALVRDNTREAYAHMSGSTYPLAILKKGSLLFINSGSGASKLFVGSLTEGAKASTELATLSPAKFALDAAEKNLWYLSGGKLHRGALGGPARVISPDTVVVNTTPSDQRRATFDMVFWLLKRYFYDKGYHGADLNRLYSEYSPLVERCTTSREFSLLTNDFIGHYNASHMGFYPSNDPVIGAARESKPHLGFLYDSAEADKGRLKVRAVVHGTPAAAENSPVKVGDTILKVNGVEITASKDVYEIIRNQHGNSLELHIAPADGGEPRTVYLKTVSPSAFGNAVVSDWEYRNAEFVRERTNGRIGYFNLLAMMGGDLAKFKTEILKYQADCDGVIMDFRFNSGGMIANQIAEYLDDTPWLFRKFGESPWMPEDVVRGESYQKAVCGMFNEASFSNAEMMCAAFTLKNLGPSVGMPTAGAVIGTSFWGIPGGMIALPMSRVHDRTDRNLELSPTAPKTIVEMDIIDIMAGRDPQLEKAIEEILAHAKKLEAKKAPVKE